MGVQVQIFTRCCKYLRKFWVFSAFHRRKILGLFCSPQAENFGAFLLTACRKFWSFSPAQAQNFGAFLPTAGTKFWVFFARAGGTFWDFSAHLRRKILGHSCVPQAQNFGSFLPTQAAENMGAFLPAIGAKFWYFLNYRVLYRVCFKGLFQFFWWTLTIPDQGTFSVEKCQFPDGTTNLDLRIVFFFSM